MSEPQIGHLQLFSEDHRRAGAAAAAREHRLAHEIGKVGGRVEQCGEVRVREHVAGERLGGAARLAAILSVAAVQSARARHEGSLGAGERSARGGRAVSKRAGHVDIALERVACGQHASLTSHSVHRDVVGAWLLRAPRAAVLEALSRTLGRLPTPIATAAEKEEEVRHHKAHEEDERDAQHEPKGYHSEQALLDRDSEQARQCGAIVALIGRRGSWARVERDAEFARRRSQRPLRGRCQSGLSGPRGARFWNLRGQVHSSKYVYKKNLARYMERLYNRNPSKAC